MTKGRYENKENITKEKSSSSCELYKYGKNKNLENKQLDNMKKV